MKLVKILAAAITALVVIAALFLVFGIPSGFLTSAIADRVERDTGYRLSIAGAARISLWPSLNVTLNDVTLRDPKDRDGQNRLTMGSIQADMTLSSVWSGHPQVSELVITRPTVYVPLLRERIRDANPSARLIKSDGGQDVGIDRVTVIDGAIAFSNPRDRVEQRIDGINADIVIDAERKVDIGGTARAGNNPLKFALKAALPPAPVDRQNIPVDFKLDAPALLRAPLSAKAEVRLNGSVVMINGLTGTLSDGAFNGWASVEIASKPLVKLDLDFQRLDLAASKPAPTSGAQPWSNAPIDLSGLNYVDAQVRVSAATLDIAEAHFSPAAIDATLAAGVLKASVSKLGVYGGQADGELIVDASSGNPTYAMHCDLAGVRALPLLQALADFDKLDGKMQAKIAARSMGASQHAIMANLGGTVFATFQDGAIRGLNVAKMIRSLTASPLSGWQESGDQATDLTQLSASFRIDRGQATTTDLNLVGPLVRVSGAGTIDLGTKMMAFRVEPKLVMTTEGQGSTANPVGFGIPVMIDGPWAEPRIYPDMQGVLQDPDAAYAKLREMGKGLFGANGGGLGGLLGGLGGLSGAKPNTGTGTAGSATGAGGAGATDPLGGKLGETLGNLIQQGIGTSRGRSIPPPSAATDPQTPTSAPLPPVPAPAASAPASPTAEAQDSQPMNDLLKQLFNR